VQAVLQAGFESDLPRVPGFYIQRKEGHTYWSIAGMGGLLIPVRDVQQRIVGLIVRADEPKLGKKYTWLSSKSKDGTGPGSPVHVPLFTGDTAVARVTEGALKADVATALSGILTIGLPGVATWRRAAAVLRHFNVKTARLAFEADARTNATVAGALAKLASHLAESGFAVELERWSIEHGKGIDDLLAAGQKPEVVAGEGVAPAIAEICQAARGPKTSSTGSSFPVIQGNKRQLRDVTEDARQALVKMNNPPQVFQRGGVLTRLRIKADDGSPFLEPLDTAALRGVLARCADWFIEVKTKDGGDLDQAPPPKDVVVDFGSLPNWEGVPILTAVVECPTFSPSGQLVATPGYDSASRLWFHPASGLCVPEVPSKPTDAVILESRDLIDELFHDFPFVDDASASRAHATAALLLPFVRQMIDGPTPLHLIDAPVEGTGKTLLAQIIAVVSTGRAAEAIAEGSGNEEWRKRLTAILAEGPTFIVLDNLSRILDTSSLAAVLTSRVWKDRILGYTKTASLPNTAVWMASGNNCRMSRELARRTLWCRLDAKADAPWERTSFRHPNLLRWAKDNRGRVENSGLTSRRCYEV
jgi:putative DNA primase/helicase